jgi:hypothetical protein
MDQQVVVSRIPQQTMLSWPGGRQHGVVHGAPGEVLLHVGVRLQQLRNAGHQLLGAIPTHLFLPLALAQGIRHWRRVQALWKRGLGVYCIWIFTNGGMGLHMTVSKKKKDVKACIFLATKSALNYPGEKWTRGGGDCGRRTSPKIAENCRKIAEIAGKLQFFSKGNCGRFHDSGQGKGNFGSLTVDREKGRQKKITSKNKAKIK